MTYRSYFLLAFTFSILAYSCRVEKKVDYDVPIYELTKSIVDDSAMVVTAHPIASQVGKDIMLRGGNAVDAAIAVQFSLAVCYPVAGNIGGGGFMVYRSADGTATTLDYREMAPAAATSDMYLDDNGDAIADKSRFGALAVGVPGTVAGMYAAFAKYSALKDWNALLQPAIETANNGYKVTHKQAELLNKYADNFIAYNTHETVFSQKVWRGGDLMVQKDLGKTLTAIAEQGPSGFYEGSVADLFVAQMVRSGGIITHEDLKNYKAKWRDPIRFTYRGHDVIGMPPPSSGGIAMAQVLGMIEPYDVGSYRYHSAQHIHLVAEAERRAFADRSRHLGDADYYDVPVTKLMEKKYLAEHMSSFDPLIASKSSEIEAGNLYESMQTTHYSIVDLEGNAVSMTTTLNGHYGSKLAVDGAGFLLNNEMDDFSAKPGTPNMFGLVGAEANKIEPGKRMLSSMSPTIVERDGKLMLVCGTPGGSTIITSVLQVVSNVIDFDMDAADAVTSPRFHHQWLPDLITLEDVGFDSTIVDQLNEMGHTVEVKGKLGKVEAIKIRANGDLEGAADIRADDDVKGF